MVAVVPYRNDGFNDGNSINAVSRNGSSLMSLQYHVVRRDILRRCFAILHSSLQLFLKFCLRPCLVCDASGITGARVVDWVWEYEGDDIEDEGNDED